MEMVAKILDVKLTSLGIIRSWKVIQIRHVKKKHVAEIKHVEDVSGKRGQFTAVIFPNGSKALVDGIHTLEKSRSEPEGMKYPVLFYQVENEGDAIKLARHSNIGRRFSREELGILAGKFQQEGKTINEIASLLHDSPSTIRSCLLINKVPGQYRHLIKPALSTGRKTLEYPLDFTSLRDMDGTDCIQTPEVYEFIIKLQRDNLILVDAQFRLLLKLWKESNSIPIEEIFEQYREQILFTRKEFITEFIDEKSKQHYQLYPKIIKDLNPKPCWAIDLGAETLEHSVKNSNEKIPSTSKILVDYFGFENTELYGRNLMPELIKFARKHFVSLKEISDWTEVIVKLTYNKNPGIIIWDQSAYSVSPYLLESLLSKRPSGKIILTILNPFYIHRVFLRGRTFIKLFGKNGFKIKNFSDYLILYREYCKRLNLEFKILARIEEKLVLALIRIPINSLI